jgi:hypothetical protein
MAAGFSGGCMGFFHSVNPPTHELGDPCHALPRCCRDHVYIFLLNGLDPGNYCNLGGLREYLHSLGFNKTYYGQLYHGPWFEKEILRLHNEDPDARFVLVGFSYGANVARSITQDLKPQGVQIDLLVYLGGNTLTNTPRDRPENAGQIVNVLATGWIWNGDTLDGAENVQLPDVWHFGSPTHRQTLEILSRDLTAIAAAVPYEVKEEDSTIPWIEDESAPPPRPLKSGARRRGDDWDFLKPVSQLHALEKGEW